MQTKKKVKKKSSIMYNIYYLGSDLNVLHILI